MDLTRAETVNSLRRRSATWPRLLAVALLADVWGTPPRAGAEDKLVLPIVFHVATEAGRPVVGPAFLSERLERANQVFAPYAVGFAKVGERALGPEHGAIESRADRDVLGAEVGRGAIDCFVVRSLRDVDDPKQVRRGVHWHSQTYAGAHFVILSSIAGINVLAHELGHFLGNPKHSNVQGNLMSYTRPEGLPVLDATQVARMKLAVQGYLQRRELKPVRDR